jgi:hypothetical protein
LSRLTTLYAEVDPQITGSPDVGVLKTGQYANDRRDEVADVRAAATTMSSISGSTSGMAADDPVGKASRIPAPGTSAMKSW